ncbi:hypothetical protein Slala05_81240 [Streptomyces lavendulae subsp. lavendulae]|nr:hypothetical protein Slala05_81240 [Streptomyces lavendulae subsp. lavendulae]
MTSPSGSTTPALKTEPLELSGPDGPRVARPGAGPRGLDHRGLLRDWDPIPEGAQQTGQTLGGTGPNRGTGLTARLVVSLTDTLWTPLHRGVYWTNLPHVQALEHWKDRWGPGPTTGRTAATPDALTERTRIAAHIITTGDIIRTALTRSLNGH